MRYRTGILLFKTCSRVRGFVVTGDIKYIKEFYEEVNVSKRRDKAVEKMEVMMHGTDTALYKVKRAGRNGCEVY